MIQIIHFSDTETAYDACQIDSAIHGAILIIEREQVVGVADTWPVALSTNHGALHAPKPGALCEVLDSIARDWIRWTPNRDLSELFSAAEIARNIIKARNW